MCGIAGLFIKNHYTTDRLPDLKLMMESLKHRGPDHTGLWYDPHIFLGQARLSIIDLSENANQPIFNEDKSVALVCNGEIYNFSDLRNRLVKSGHCFLSKGDTEVIVHLYEEQGEAFLHELDGMFSLALWDAHKKKLLLARDRTGKKPLFYFHSPSLFAFASEIKAFFPLKDIPIERDETMFPYYFILGNIPAPHTFYKNIFSLEPAHFLSVEIEKSPKILKYWHIENFFRTKKNVAPEEAKSNVQYLLKKAVQKRLISDVPLGTFLSGGIDSTIVTGIMVRELGKQVQTFSIGFKDDAAYDETPYARLAAAHFGTDHTEHHVSASDVPTMIDHLLWQHDGPFGDASALPTSIVSRFAKKKVTVILNGDGGDEVFGGYHRFIAARWMECFVPSFWKLAKQITSPLYKPILCKSRFGQKWNRFIQAANLPLTERLIQWTSYFYSELNQLLSKDVYHHLDIDQNLLGHIFDEDMKELSPLSKILYFNLKTYLSNDLNIKMDRASMSVALETRSPFLDRELMEYCASFPDHLLIRGFQTKYILKVAYQDLLPPKILKRGKAGFGVPLGKWFRGPLKDLLREDLGDTSLSRHYLNETFIQELLKAHWGGTDHSLRLWNLWMFKRWLKKLDHRG